MNFVDNIRTIGNYRFRPSDPLTSKYRSIPNNFDQNDDGEFYTGATDADVVVDGGFDNNNVPAVFVSKKQKEGMLYSLEDCLGRFRPRSGINKTRYLSNYIHHSNPEMTNRPRYYMSSKDDKFKYWTSYRTESGIERGIANEEINGQYYISDTAPFVIYKEPVPTNKIVVKIQTNVGTVDLGPFNNAYASSEDPFFGEQNQTTPVTWKIQYLKENSWIDAVEFNQSTRRSDGNPIFGPDGYMEISYGVIVPEQYREIFVNAGAFAAPQLLPQENIIGYSYLVGQTDESFGVYYIWTGAEYETFDPTFGWYLSEEEINGRTSLVTNLVSPTSYLSDNALTNFYTEFQYISGIRLVVETMNKFDSTFDLIELSPRLFVDLSDKIQSFSITKPASDIGITGLPVGQLLAATGSVEIFDYDLSFNQNNTNSIIAKYSNKNLQVKFYEMIKDVEGEDYFVPIKTMYSEGFPETQNTDRLTRIDLRDLFFYFESTTAPQILVQEASLSYAVSLLLDSIGFSNYTFKRLENEKDPIIPYFFIEPDTSIAEILNRLARSTQTTMFFDEYNNFVLMSKDYVLPSTNQRETDIILSGTKDFRQAGPYKNAQTESSQLSNIVEISSQKNDVYNSGSINYTTRYIQRSFSSIRQASLTDRDKTWIYKPALLWEITGTENTKSVNDEVENQASYVLGAIPLNSDLSDAIPRVENNQLINNIMDLGEGVYWITRYNGYFYANGEIIKYDAVQYNIPGLSGDDGTGNVWISNVQEYNNYFSKLPFNGKIYPTGLVRIYSEPNYITINNQILLQDGAVAKHGRCQFGTGVVSDSGDILPVYHSAGLNTYWSDNANVRGCRMDYKYLIGGSREILISGVSYNTQTEKITYTTSQDHGLSDEDTVTISDINPSIYNFKNLKIETVPSGNTFVVSKSLASSVTQVQKTISSVEGDSEFVNYKTTENHSFATDELVTISGISREGYNGTFKVLLELSEPGVATILDPKGFFVENTTTGSANLSSAKATVVRPSYVSGGKVIKLIPTEIAAAGINNDLAKQTQRNGIIKNFLSSSEIKETEVGNLYATQTGTTQSSAFIMNGPPLSVIDDPTEFISYVYKPLNNAFKHFGTRMRIIGKIENSVLRGQTPVGSTPYYSLSGNSPEQNTTVGGASGGLAIMVNPETNVGYYFEIAALTENNIQSYEDSDNVYNVLFYKIKAGEDAEKAVPIRLYGGLAKIIVDSGTFAGQARIVGEENPTVYDLAVEYQDIGSTRRFYLYINNKLVTIVDDESPLPKYNNMGLFVRGSSKVMFENLYALAANYSQNTSSTLDTPVNSAFGDKEIDLNEAFRKYSLSSMIQSVYLSGTSPSEPPKYNIYFEEFGTIMREAAYLNVRYDKAYPALYAKIANTFNLIKGYVTTGFLAGSYGAEFLIFNATDTAINLDETTGNYLRIQGITFTQSSTNQLTVDEYFSKNSDFSDPKYSANQIIVSPNKFKEQYQDIKNSRTTYGKKEFSLDSPYIQTRDDANELMGWLVNKIMKPRTSVGVSVFGLPIIQLGDIVSIDYKEENVDIVLSKDRRFVVYNIEYSNSGVGPQTTLYLSEVT